ncbi:TniQ protein [Paenibacillus tianmuensis]|uniref:TniQ protein n=1 Tax=Paenibacillus tianmuensis TaxID=624147 RepID=A0A1G4TMC4_9BACL|nr:TniQ family protein [Paenibacillus tianmuensis]SCW81955.1 TniQ protein [Paenibacillus tianmuensis]
MEGKDTNFFRPFIEYTVHTESETAQYSPLHLQNNINYSCTALYCLEPKGIGTASVESLTSYIIRLSEVHNVPTNWLLNMFKPYLKSDVMLDLVLQKRNYSSTFYINSSNHIAQDVVSACEMLTGNINLWQLTLTNWSGIRKRDLVKEKRVWCPLCLHEMKEKKELYEPLIWNIKLINICLKHKVLLEEKCPFCSYKGNVLQSLSKVGYCPKCRKFLGGINGLNANTGNLDFLWESWKCNIVTEMIINNDQMHHILTPEKITQLIRNMVQHVAAGNQSEFSRRLNLLRTMTGQWCRGGHIPELERLLKFSYYYQVSLVTLLTNFPWEQSHFNTGALRYFTRKTQVIVDPQQLREVLRKIIDRNDYPPLSLAQVIKEVQYTESVLYYNAGEECKLITKRYREYLREQKIIRQEKLYTDIKRAILLLLEQNLPLTEAHIRNILKYRIYYREFIKLRDRILDELNIAL